MIVGNKKKGVKVEHRLKKKRERSKKKKRERAGER